jgi:hypothetical protein
LDSSFQGVGRRSFNTSSSSDKLSIDDDSTRRVSVRKGGSMFNLLDQEQPDESHHFSSEEAPLSASEDESSAALVKNQALEAENKKFKLIIFSVHKESPCKSELAEMAAELLAYSHLSLGTALGSLFSASVDQSKAVLDMTYLFLDHVSPLLKASHLKDIEQAVNVVLQQYEDLRQDVPKLDLILGSFLGHLAFLLPMDHINKLFEPQGLYPRILLPLKDTCYMNSASSLTPIASIYGQAMQVLQNLKGSEFVGELVNSTKLDIPAFLSPISSEAFDSESIFRKFLDTFDLKRSFLNSNALTDAFDSASPAEAVELIPLDELAKLMKNSRNCEFVASKFHNDLMSFFEQHQNAFLSEAEVSFRHKFDTLVSNDLLKTIWLALFSIFQRLEIQLLDKLAIALLNSVTKWWMSSTIMAIPKDKRKYMIQSLFKHFHYICPNFFTASAYISYSDEVSTIDKSEALFALNMFISQMREEFDAEMNESLDEYEDINHIFNNKNLNLFWLCLVAINVEKLHYKEFE